MKIFFLTTFLLLLVAPPADGSPIVRIHFVPPAGTERDSMIEGATLAFEEARRAFELLGKRIELTTGQTPRDEAVIIRGEGSDPGRRVFIEMSDRSFTIESSRRNGDVTLVAWHPQLSRYGAEQLNERYEQRFERSMNEEAWAAWMAVKVVAEVSLRRSAVSFETLLSLEYDGHKGSPLRFDAVSGSLIQPMYELRGGDSLHALEPAETPLHPGKTEEITVTASRLGAGAVGQAAMTIVISGEGLLSSPAPTLDDVLRQVPGFTLFRRSGSRNANPTAQGVSLRGIGPSGASRTIVLDDGIPLNDPFGGWVNWGRVPLAAIEGVEIVRGGTSDLHGSGALSGVIQIVRQRNPAPVIRLFSGEGQTAAISAAASFLHGPYTLALDGEHFQTRGHIPVAPEHRGAVDRPAGVERTVADASVSRDWSENARAFVRLSGLTESRDNGTALQTNATTLAQIAMGFDRTLGNDRFSLRGFGLEQDYEQTFSAVFSGRNEERLTRLQEVPSSSHGVSAHWLRNLGGGRAFVAGAEFKRVEGRSDEWAPGSETIASSNGGTQRMASVFGETLFAPIPDTSLILSARWDRWENHGGPAGDPGQRRVESAFSPRLAVVRKLNDRWTATASAYRSFRAPTLNELYRSFRVGNVVTAANPDLEAEGVVGIEGGVQFMGDRLETRINLFRMELQDPVANVTLSVTPELVNRRRENLGRTLTKGVEMDVDLAISPVWSLSAGYLYADAHVIAFSEDRSIEGRRLAHVAPHTASSSVRYDDEVWSGTINLRWSDEAFEDERNSMVLNDYLALDALVSRRIHGMVHAFAGVENLTDERIEVGMTPLPTLGAPRTWRFGIDLRRGGRRS